MGTAQCGHPSGHGQPVTHPDRVAAETYINRAEELRVIAMTMSDPQARQILLTVASDYEKLAKTRLRLASEDEDRPEAEKTR